jgi:hypothetical protein
MSEGSVNSMTKDDTLNLIAYDESGGKKTYAALR